MKLKPIIALMTLLGLSAPAFADSYQQAQLDSMKASIAKMETIIGQNQNANIAQPQDWFNRITISGLANVDGFIGSRNPVFQTSSPGFAPAFATVAGVPAGLLPILLQPGGNVSSFGFLNPGIPLPTGANSGASQNIALDNANVFLHAVVNEWVTADIDFVYMDNGNNFILRPNNTSALDEAYVTIGNFAKTPVFFRAGRIYEPFGMYERYPMLTNPTQLLSETRATSAQFGFVTPEGWYASIFGFKGTVPQNKTGSNARVAGLEGAEFIGGPVATPGNVVPGALPNANTNKVQNFGADVGYQYSSDEVGAKVDVGYLHNMADVNFLAAPLASFASTVSGLAVSGDLRLNAFDAGLRYVTALQSFSSVDYSNVTNPLSGAKPWAAGVDLGYTFPVASHSSRIAIGYQRTGDAAYTGGQSAGSATGLPLYRIYGDYMVNISKWTDLGFAVYSDRNYKVADTNLGALALRGQTSTVGMVRLSVKVA